MTLPLPAAVLPAWPAAPGGRPSWSGLLTFSLVGIPLKAYPAVRARALPAFHLRHAPCGQRLRYAKQCPAHGPVDAAAIVRAVDYGPGQHVALEAQELDALRPAPDRALRLECFLDPAQVDPLLFAGRGLYLLPDGPAAEPGYAVLCRALAERGRWALGQVVLGGHRQLVVVRPAGAVLVLHALHYPEQVRACPRAASACPAGAGEELQLAGRLIDAAGGSVDWTRYEDRAAQELRALVEAKLEGRVAAEGGPEQVLLPLLQALRQSLAEAAPTDLPAAAEAPRPRRKQPAPRKLKRRTA